MIRVFIGYDPVEIEAYHVLADSIIRHASEPVTIAPINRQLLSRGWDNNQSTDFAFARFMVPSLCDFTGWAIWLDADMLVRTDIAELWALRNPDNAVQVVPKDFWPQDGTKFLGRPQRAYPALSDGTNRKLWSAMMLMNCGKCAKLTREYVEAAPGLELHQFKWLWPEDIGYLPNGWQHVPDLDAHDDEAKLIHWTLGGPWFDETREVDYADEWFATRDRVAGLPVAASATAHRAA